jgi:hypothetical protein
MAAVSIWLERHQRPAAFLAAFLVFMVLHHVEDVRWFRWDAGDYWSLAGLHKLLDFPDEIRGYFYPMLLAPGRYVFDLRPDWGYVPYRIESSAAYAYMLAVALPAFYRRVFGGDLSFSRRLIVPVLVSCIFPGLIVYPLSDLPAVCLLLGAILCGIYSVASDGRPLARYGYLLLSGMLAYGAYNTRTIFLFPMLALAAAVPLVLYRGHEWRPRSLAILTFLLGALIAATPQSLINVRHHGTWTPAVITVTGGRSLFAQQLLWGVVVQRYETTLDPSAQLPAVVYPDQAGERLLGALHIDGDFTVADYLRLLAGHPVDFMGIYGRHVVNGLDVRDGDVYSKRRSSVRDGTGFCNFLVVFLGLSIILMAAFTRPIAGEKAVIAWFWVFVMLLPVLAIIPGAIETRFFLSLHLALYSAIAFSMDIHGMAASFRHHWLLVVMAFGIAACIFFAVSLTTLSTYEYGVQGVDRLLRNAQEPSGIRR